MALLAAARPDAHRSPRWSPASRPSAGAWGPPGRGLEPRQLPGAGRRIPGRWRDCRSTSCIYADQGRRGVHQPDNSGNRKNFSFRANMQPDDIVAMFEGMMTRDGSVFKLNKLEPMSFGGHKVSASSSPSPARWTASSSPAWASARSPTASSMPCSTPRRSSAFGRHQGSVEQMAQRQAEDVIRAPISPLHSPQAFHEEESHAQPEIRRLRPVAAGLGCSRRFTRRSQGGRLQQDHRVRDPVPTAGGSDVGALLRPALSEALPVPTVVVKNAWRRLDHRTNQFVQRAKPDGLSIIGTSGSTQLPYLR